ncbi:MAG: thiamine-phosphate kinase [Methyloligellaceae bacterium]
MSGGEEFEIIARIFAPLASESGALELKDDAAVLTVTEGHELVVTCDTLVEGVHFLKDDPPRSIGHKALAANISDLTAKGARGYVYTLSLAVPKKIGTDWLEEFAAGLGEVQDRTGISLIGGDTTAATGPPVITITAMGLVSPEHAVTRLGAKPGDRLYVSGTIGDAYLGLKLLQEPDLAQDWRLLGEDVAFLVDRYRRPALNNELALLVRNFAKAAIDVSDGLIGDIEKLCRASHVGARVETAAVPFSAAAKKALVAEPELLPDLITAGDDYVVVAAVSEKSSQAFESEAEAHDGDFTGLGEIADLGDGVQAVDERGQVLSLKRKGFSHF